MNNDLNVYSFTNEQVCVNVLYKHFLEIVYKKLNINGVVNIAISGGNTPLPFFKFIAENWQKEFNWITNSKNINIFWVDERAVSINHKDSNSGSFMKIIKGLPFNLFVINGDSENPEERHKNMNQQY